MKCVVLCAITGMLLYGCKKEKNNPEPVKEKTVVELLTQKKWILTGYGFDDNNNKQVDDHEDMIQECQKDNSYEFFVDLKGVVKENADVCSTGSPVVDFEWKLGSDNKELLISLNPTEIVKLDEVSLVLRHFIPGLNDSARFTTVYKH